MNQFPKLYYRKSDGALAELDVEPSDPPAAIITSTPLRFKKLHPEATLPQYAKFGDAGLDLTAVSKEYNYDFGFWEFGTGLAVEIPHGYVGLVFPRSSISKTPYSLINSVGVIDSGFRGEIKFRFSDDSNNLYPSKFGTIRKSSLKDVKPYEVGDRIGQLVILKLPSFQPKFVEELSDTERGVGGFGSTGQ